MATESISLTKTKVGGKYEYWVLQWYDANGKHHTKSIGNAAKMSRRQAKKIQQRKIAELEQNPGRRSAGAGTHCTISAYLDSYLAARKSELAPGTHELHETTTRYLIAFFGKNKRLDKIARPDARAFKTALASNKLQHVKKRKCTMIAPTVDIHIRNAKVMLNRAVEDDRILYNPFDRLPKYKPVQKGFHYVDADEFRRMMDHAGKTLKLLIALCRLAALRRGEALALEWPNIDWGRNHIHVIAKSEWAPKDKDPRTVPMCPELLELLLQAHEDAQDSQQRVISSISHNPAQSMYYLFKRAAVKRYAKPFHSLRKSCTDDWSKRHPAHVVQEWAGHSDFETTRQHYLRVSESEYDVEAQTPFFSTKKQTKKRKNEGKPELKGNERKDVKHDT